MKKVSKYLCFTLFIVILLFTGGKIQFYLDQQAELSFHMYPRIFSFVFSPFSLVAYCASVNLSITRKINMYGNFN